VFALGATLYELLTLQLPFPGNTAREVLDAIRSEDPVDPRKHNPKLAPDLAAIVLKALEKDPDRRYQRAQAFADDLRAFLDYRPVQARRTNLTTRLRRSGRRLLRRHPALLAGAGVGVGALVLAVLLSEGRDREVEPEYERLCAMAEVETSGYLGRSQPTVDVSFRTLLQRELLPVEQLGASPRVLYDRAIALLPGRPEAWFGRALSLGSPVQQRLVDLDEALACGLAARTFHLARACLLGALGKSEESERERTLAAGLPQATPEAAYFEGILESAAGNRTEALELLTRAIEGNPKASGIRSRALRVRASLRRQGGDHAGSLADLHVLLDQGDDGARTCACIAITWRALGKPDEAERWYQTALRRAREQGNVATWRGLCVACMSSPWFAQATEQARAAHPEAIDTMILRANAIQDDRPAEALALCQRALSLDPAHTGLHHTLATTFLRMKDFGAALDAIERAIQLEPGSVGAWRTKGIVLGHLGRFDDALAAFDEAEQLYPTNRFTFVSRGVLLANKLQRYEAALEQFDRAIALGGCDYDVHHNRVRVLRKLKRPAEALQAADQALAMAPAGEPSRVLVLRDRSKVLVDLQRHEDALEGLLEATRLAPNDVESRTDLGVLLHNQLGRHEEALAAFEEAIALDPRRAQNRHNKATVLRSLKRYDDALEAIDAAILCEDDPNLHSWRGILLHNYLRRYEDALAAFGRALQLDSQRAVDWTNKAIVLRSLKRYDQALEAIDEAIRLEGRNQHNLTLRGELLNAQSASRR
jgi:tetratricopeptide (TPR) repeat protein